MTEFLRSDRLLARLRRARPAEDPVAPSPKSAEAMALRDRVLASDPFASSTGEEATSSARRRPMRYPVLAGAAALVVGGAVGGVVVADNGAGPKPPVTLDAKTIAYRTNVALDEAMASGIAYTETVLATAAGKVTVTDSWSYGDSSRTETLNADGTPLLDRSSVTTGGSTHGRVVDYSDKTWWATSSPAKPAFDAVAALRAALRAAHGVSVSAAAHVGAERAIELATVPPASGNSGTAASGSSGASGNSGAAGNSGTTSTSLPATLCSSNVQTSIDGAAGSSGATGNSGNSGSSGAGAPSGAGGDGSSANSGVAGPSGTSADVPPATLASGSAPSSGAVVGASHASTEAMAMAMALRSLRVWLDPSTCLPMELALPAQAAMTARTTLHWLSPTSPNLALLSAPTPAGFTQVAGPSAD